MSTKINVQFDNGEYWGVVSRGVTYELEPTGGFIKLRPQFTTHYTIRWVNI